MGTSKLITKFEIVWRAISNLKLTPEYRFHPTRKWRLDWFHESGVGVEIEGGIWTKGRHTRGKGFLAVNADLTIDARSFSPSGNFTAGVFMQSSSALRTTGTGSLTLNATGALGSLGLVLGADLEATGTGNLLVNALGGETATIDLFSNDWTISKTGGTATLNGRLSIGNLVTNAGAYAVNLNNGGTIASGTFNHTGTLTLNSTPTDTLTFTNGFSHTAGLTEVQGTIATTDGVITLGDLILQGDTIFDLGTTDFSFSNAITPNNFNWTVNAQNITLGTVLNMDTGNLRLTANRRLVLNNSTIDSTSGTITLTTQNTSGSPVTLDLSGSAFDGSIDIKNSQIDSDSGAITLSANADNSISGDFVGLLLGYEGSPSSIASNTGEIRLTGQGGNSGGDNDGVLLWRGQITSEFGDMTLDGTGGPGGNGEGVNLYRSILESTGTGSSAAQINIIGRTVTAPTGAYSVTSAVATVPGSGIFTVDGDITIVGSTTTPNFTFGTFLNTPVIATGTGSLTVTQTGAAGIGADTELGRFGSLEFASGNVSLTSDRSINLNSDTAINAAAKIVTSSTGNVSLTADRSITLNSGTTLS